MSIQRPAVGNEVRDKGERIHLFIREDVSGSCVPARKPCEWHCRICRSRVTVTPNGDEVGHHYPCPQRPASLPQRQSVDQTGKIDEACPECGYRDDEHHERCSRANDE